MQDGKTKVKGDKHLKHFISHLRINPYVSVFFFSCSCWATNKNKKKVAKDNDKSFLHLLQIVIYLILVVQCSMFFLSFLLFFFWYFARDNVGRVTKSKRHVFNMYVTIHYISLFYHTNCVPFLSLLVWVK